MIFIECSFVKDSVFKSVNMLHKVSNFYKNHKSISLNFLNIQGDSSKFKMRVVNLQQWELTVNLGILYSTIVEAQEANLLPLHLSCIIEASSIFTISGRMFFCRQNKRFKRANLQNYQIHSDKQKLWKLLKRKWNWIMLDVPWTGTGTFRRNPDMKWKFSYKRLQELILVQDQIVKEVLPML